MTNKLAPVGSLTDVRKRVQEYEERVKAGVLEHNSVTRDRAYLLELLDNGPSLAKSLAKVLRPGCDVSPALDPPLEKAAGRDAS